MLLNLTFLLYIGPTMPSNVTVIATTSTSLLVKWSQHSEDFITGFNISATYVGPCDDYRNHRLSKLTNLNASTREMNITDLQEHSNYSILITAFNSNGSSPAPPITAVTEDSGACEICIINFNSTSIMIIIILLYIIIYYH